MMKCRVCGEKMVLREMVHGCRAEGGETLLKTTPYRLYKQDISLYECPRCSHMQTKYLLPENFYGNYEDGAGALQYYGALAMSEKKLKKLSGYAKNPKSLIEIGCGAGHDLLRAQKYFKECTGVDPSAAECRKAENAGLNIRCAYFDKKLALQQSFSAFCSFQVFEHLEEPYAALEYAAEILEEDGVGLLNVPDGEKIMRAGAWHQVILEHINYFTPFSLAVAAKKAGFEILDIDCIDETMEIDIYLRKRGRAFSLDTVRAQQKEAITVFLNGCERITIFGAGAKAHIYSGLLTDKKIAHIVDSDISKSGKYVADIPIAVEAVSQEILQESDAVVIFASSYNAEIIQDLRGKYSYTGKILYFEAAGVREAPAVQLHKV